MINLEEGLIIYFDPFYFKNGNTAKSKYFVVIKKINDETILASLPTSKDCIPENLLIDDGCIEESSIGVNCFTFSEKTTVTNCGKCFPRKTFIYGVQLDTYNHKHLVENYIIEGVDYIVFGKMRKQIFQELISCLKNSKIVKRKFKRML